MSNNELNIFEIMGEEEPGKKSSQQTSGMSARREETHTWNGEGREQTVPDPFFQDVIDQVFSEKRSKPKVYGNTSSSYTYSQPYNQHQTYNQQMGSYVPAPSPHRRVLRRFKEIVGTWGGRLKGLGRIKRSGRTHKAVAMEEAVKGGWKEALLETAIVILIVVLVYNFVISISHVTGDSMSPNFCDGDRVLILRIAKGTIKKGDVIVFETAQGEKLMKRVVATEGDTVDISKSKGGLYINGESTEESNIYTVTSIVDEKVKYPVTVTEDCYFVLGDNRVNSKDSRDSKIGLVKKEDVIGKVVLDIRGT